MNNELENMQSWSKARYYSDNFLEGLRKIMKDFSQNVGTTILLRKLKLSIYDFTALVDLGRFLVS
jgi:hypothetical protein